MSQSFNQRNEPSTGLVLAQVWLNGSGLTQVFLRLEPSKLLLFIIFLYFGSMAQEFYLPFYTPLYFLYPHIPSPIYVFLTLQLLVYFLEPLSQRV
jgi:hypothetical protein